MSAKETLRGEKNSMSKVVHESRIYGLDRADQLRARCAASPRSQPDPLPSPASRQL